LLNCKLGITEICETSDGDSLVFQLNRFKPDLLILDWSLPHRPASQTYRPWQESTPPLQMIVLSVKADDAAQAKALGAAFIHKASPAEEVLAQLEKLLKTHKPIPSPMPSLAAQD
jgi:DNA-binding response OmpR family regulator